jgi:hypothetical protein
MPQGVAPYALSSRFTTAALHTSSPPAQSVDPMAALQQQVSSLLEKFPCAAYTSHQRRQPSEHVPRLLPETPHIAACRGLCLQSCIEVCYALCRCLPRCHAARRQ